jgi:hypothetical protein
MSGDPGMTPQELDELERMVRDQIVAYGEVEGLPFSYVRALIAEVRRLREGGYQGGVALSIATLEALKPHCGRTAPGHECETICLEDAWAYDVKAYLLGELKRLQSRVGGVAPEMMRTMRAAERFAEQVDEDARNARTPAAPLVVSYDAWSALEAWRKARR